MTDDTTPEPLAISAQEADWGAVAATADGLQKVILADLALRRQADQLPEEYERAALACFGALALALSPRRRGFDSRRRLPARSRL